MAAGCSDFQDLHRTRRFSLTVCLLVLLVQIELALCKPALQGYRPKDVVKGIEDGVFVVPNEGSTTLYLYGSDFTNETAVKFTENAANCTTNIFGGGSLDDIIDGSWATLHTSFSDISQKSTLYFCFCSSESGSGILCNDNGHQGSEERVRVIVAPPSGDLLPLPVEIVFILVLMAMSGLFSGLNLGLMALDPTTLKIVMESGTKKQRKYAKSIYGVRKHGNYLLCTLLLGNVLVNSTLTVLLDNVLGSGVYAVVSSTIAIVIFGEIVPQAICSRHGLFIGAKTIYLTYIFMVLTFPLSFPISRILNCILGKEIGAIYNRDQLLELLKVTDAHNDLEKDEVNIISGALEFRNKTVEEVMTKFGDVYCLDVEGVLNFRTMREIYESGFSRIPVYEGDKQNIVGLLYLRDLAFVDPDDESPISNVLSFYNHEVKFVYSDCHLDEVLQEFTEGKSHMAVVQRVVTETEGDPFYEIVGVVTLEDIVEEILQREIVDESDRFLDNRTLKPREHKLMDFGEFIDPSDNTPVLSSQQRLAIYQFLSTSVKPFHADHISQNVLKRLLRKNIVRSIILKEAKREDLCLYRANTPASYFMLILEGCMQVEIGKDGLQFESRSFSHFGSEALLHAASNRQLNSRPNYVPDFTVRPATDCQILIVTWRQYLAAYKATQFEQGGLTHNGSKPDVFTEEWEIAESSELQQTTGNSGLSPITKLLPKKPSQQSRRRRRTKRQQDSGTEERHLLHSSGSSVNGSPASPRSFSRENSPFDLEGVDGGRQDGGTVNGETEFVELEQTGQDQSREGTTAWTRFDTTEV